MYILTIEDHFSSAHFLTHKDGTEFEPLHGHTFKVAVEISGYELDECGMLFDFTVLREKLRNVVKKLDHRLLNEVIDVSPTSENIARYIFDELKAHLPNANIVKLNAVTVWESHDSFVKYCKGV